jgi:hypothetical protein
VIPWFQSLLFTWVHLCRYAAAELDLLSRCDAFVGTFSSSFSRLAYLLMVGRRGGLAPYVSLDGVTWQPESHGK